jgi:GT2 family glycosyltransferase
LNYPNYEILVVDNAPSTPATADLMKQTYSDISQVRYVREDRPGLVWARNCGLMEAKGEIVAYTDDDVVVDQHWLAELVKGFCIAENVACVTGLILPMELETPAQVWFEQFGGFSKGFARRIFNMGKHRTKSRLYPYDAGRFGSGNNMAFKTSVLRNIGGFALGLCVAGAEDITAYFRVITRGYTLVYEPAAIVYHLHRRDYIGLRKQMYWYGIGLTAYLMECLVDNPKLFVSFVTKVPYSLFYMMSSRSPKNMKKSPEYPKELTFLERKGTLYGPLAYLRGCWRARKLRKPSDPPRLGATTLDRKKV